MHNNCHFLFNFFETKKINLFFLMIKTKTETLQQCEFNNLPVVGADCFKVNITEQSFISKIQSICPFLCFVRFDTETQYFEDIHNFVMKLCCSIDVPDPSKSKEKFLQYLKVNSEFFSTSTTKDLIQQFNLIQTPFTMHMLLFDFLQKLRNPSVFLYSFETLFNSEYLVKDDICYEELFDHFLPFVRAYKSYQKLSFEIENQQLTLMELLTNICMSMPKTLSSYDKIYSRVLEKIFHVVNKYHENFTTLSINALRFFTKLFDEYIANFNEDEKAEKVIDFINALHPYHYQRRAIMAYFLKVMDSPFNACTYFISRLSTGLLFDQFDFEFLLDYMRENKDIEKPFQVMRHLLQTFMIGNAYSKISYLIIMENLHYFKTCARLEHWTQTFFRRTFQWLYVVERVGKYKNRSIETLNCLKALYDLNIPGMNEIVEVSCASLLNILPYRNTPIYQCVSRYFRMGEVDKTFRDEIFVLEYHVKQLKKQLLWPQEKLDKQRIGMHGVTKNNVKKMEDQNVVFRSKSNQKGTKKAISQITQIHSKLIQKKEAKSPSPVPNMFSFVEKPKYALSETIQHSVVTP